MKGLVEQSMTFTSREIAEQVRPTPLLCMGMKVLIRQLQSGHWTEQLKAVLRAAVGASEVTGNVVHPCYIHNQPTLVHAADLATRDPDFYRELDTFARTQGYQLFADRRSRDDAVSEDRRNRLLPVVVFSLGLGSTAVAAETPRAVDRTLALFESQLQHDVDEDALTAVAEPSIEPIVAEATDALAVELESILLQHYQPSAAEPTAIQQDLHQLAGYLANYPHAVSLLRSLRGKAWQMSYAADTFATEVRGNALQIHSVTVKFDPRSAAQLRRHKACDDTPGACVASPADALLHELLHAATALLQPQQFIAQGGLNSVVYPFEHEAEVIRRENALYRAMTAVDGRFRPHRHRHSGQVVASACVTCLK